MTLAPRPRPPRRSRPRSAPGRASGRLSWQWRLRRQPASRPSSTQSDYRTAQQTIQDLKTEAKHPNVGIWNVQQHIDGPDFYLAGGVPDTFTYHLHATSSGPMSVSILTFEQFAAAVDCVHQ